MSSTSAYKVLKETLYTNRIQIQNTSLSVAIKTIKRKYFLARTSFATLNNVVKLI